MSEETKKSKETAKKTTPKKPAAKKTTQKKPTAKKPSAKKPTAKKRVAEEKVKNDSEYAEFVDINYNRDTDNSTSNSTSFPDNLPQRDWAAFLFRAALLIVFGMLGWLAMWAAVTLAAVGWITSLIFNEENATLKSWIRLLGLYIKEVLDYMADEKSEMPFPLSKDFPSDK